MAIRTASGRIADALAFSRRPIHIAWGTGSPDWHKTYDETYRFDEVNTFTLAHAPIDALDLYGPDNQPYRPDVDFCAIASTGYVVRSLINSAIPENAEVRAVYRAAADYLTGLETGLVNEVGRRRALSVQFVEPDQAGPIDDAAGQRWSVAAEPTHTLLVSVKFGYDENPDVVITEIGVFVDTIAKADLPPGLDYLTPDQIEDPGYLHTLEHVTPIIRSATKRDGVDLFIEF